MGIRNYSYKLINIECLPTSVHFNLIMNFEDDISELLPYIAARLPGCTYIHGTNVINYPEKYHIIAIKPKEITITRIKDSREAKEICEHWKNFINETEKMRGSISPVYEKKLEIGPLDVFKALPGTNCGECGLPTCLAFAAAVVKREADISECEPFFKEVDPELRQGLMERLEQAGLVERGIARNERELNERSKSG